MKTYRRHLTIQDPNRIVLSNLPFPPGQQVEVLLIANDDARTTSYRELQNLFKKTQRLPQAKAISEDEIIAEIEAYRSKQ